MVLNLSLIWVLQEGGLALSTAISAIVHIIILTVILQKRLQIKIEKTVAVSLLKTVVASTVMAITCWFVLS